MKIVVFGANGLLGRAVADQLSQRGHRVTRAARSGADIEVDFGWDQDVATLRTAVHGADIVVNTVGILIEREGNTWDAIHHRAVDALAQACEAERVARIVHVSALGAGTGIPGGYMASKLAGEVALARHAVDYAVVRPALLVDPQCPSTKLFAALARMPVVGLPGLRHPGRSPLQPVQVRDVAECIARIAEHPKAFRRTIEIAGPEVITYRALLERLRREQGLATALWLPLPWWLMKVTARLAQFLPQRVFSLDTMRMLQAGALASRNEAARWLGREPRPLETRSDVDARAGFASIA